MTSDPKVPGIYSGVWPFSDFDGLKNFFSRRFIDDGFGFFQKLLRSGSRIMNLIGPVVFGEDDILHGHESASEARRGPANLRPLKACEIAFVTHRVFSDAGIHEENRFRLVGCVGLKDDLELSRLFLGRELSLLKRRHFDISPGGHNDDLAVGKDRHIIINMITDVTHLRPRNGIKAHLRRILREP